MTGWVYFIGCADQEAVKIGYSSGNPKRRMRTLQTGCPGRLELLEVLPGTPGLEARLHRAFAPLRIGGEWFSHEAKLRDFLYYFGRSPGEPVTKRMLEVAIVDVLGAVAPFHSSDPLSDEDYSASASAVPLADLVSP